MGIYYSYANLDAHEYVNLVYLHESVNPKRPVHRVEATVLFHLLRGDWFGQKIACYADTMDLPWEDPYTNDEWTDITNRVDVQRSVQEAVVDLAEEKIDVRYPKSRVDAILLVEEDLMAYERNQLAERRGAK